MGRLRRSLRDAVKRSEATLFAIIGGVIRVSVSHRWSRTLLNAIYRRLSFEQMEPFQDRFAGLFRDDERRVDPGSWTVWFVDREIVLPLDPARMWLDWDCAVSILGHEADIKRTYANLIASLEAPELFVDVGANYGTHSVLFLVHGIDVITFEPNASCHAYLRELCASNKVEPHIEDVALGAREGEVDLYFPEKGTWFGTTDAEVAERLSERHRLTERRVPQRVLDSYMQVFVGKKRILLKIDTEGNESAVLDGAVQILEQCRPVVIFESFPGAGRKELLPRFENLGYAVAHLPWDATHTEALDRETFLNSRRNNFVAVPTP